MWPFFVLGQIFILRGTQKPRGKLTGKGANVYGGSFSTYVKEVLYFKFEMGHSHITWFKVVQHIPDLLMTL